MKKIFLFVFLISTLSLSQRTFRFAWLSDIHIGYPTAEEDLKISVNDINSFNDIDFTIISGDITAIGSLKELTLAKEILDQLKKPYFIIPGNHDCKWSESGGTDFIKLWGYDRFVFEYDKYLFIGLHQGPRMRMADGFWAPEDLRWLDSILISQTEINKPIIFVTHYPLDRSIANWFEVLDKLKNYNTLAALFGHGHKNITYNFEGIPGVMGRSNLRADKIVGGYTISEVRNDSMFFFERIPENEINFWHSLSLYQREFNYEELIRPDFSVNEKFPQVKEVWSFNAGYTIGSSAVAYKENIICADASGKVYSINLNDGNVNWKFQANGPIYSTPSLSEDLIVFGSADSSIYCVNGNDGNLLWSYKTNAAVLGSPAIEGEIVYIGGSDRKFRSINLITGKLIWEFSGLNGFVETKPVIYDNKILFGVWDEHFYCLNKNSGKLEWKWRNERRGVFYSPAACWAVANNGVVFFAAPDRTLNAIEIETGKTLWRTGKFEVRETLGISEDNNLIYARTINDTIFALQAASELKEPVWITNAGFGYDISSAQIVEKDEIIFYPTKTGELYALRSNNGEILWIHKLSTGYVNTVTPISKNKIITTGFDGMIKLISVEE